MAQDAVVIAALDKQMQFVAETPSGHRVTLDAAEQFGGNNIGPQPMEMLLMSLAACTAMDVISILRKMRQQVNDYKVRVTGQRAQEHPKVYTHIAVEHIATGDIDEERLAHAIELSHTKYCPVTAMLRDTAEIQTHYTIQND